MRNPRATGTRGHRDLGTGYECSVEKKNGRGIIFQSASRTVMNVRSTPTCWKIASDALRQLPRRRPYLGISRNLRKLRETFRKLREKIHERLRSSNKRSLLPFLYTPIILILSCSVFVFARSRDERTATPTGSDRVPIIERIIDDAASNTVRNEKAHAFRSLVFYSIRNFIRSRTLHLLFPNRPNVLFLSAYFRNF